MQDKILISGFGGQGVLRIGQMIAYAGMENGLAVSWLPAYSTEMRGGTANCSVIVSDKEIASPVINKCTVLIAMNMPSLTRFEHKVIEGGTILCNSSLILEQPRIQDVQVYCIPANEIAEDAGNAKGVNMVFLGAYCAISKCVPLETMLSLVDKMFTGTKAGFAKSNKSLLCQGFQYIDRTR